MTLCLCRESESHYLAVLDAHYFAVLDVHYLAVLDVHGEKKQIQPTTHD